jgi:hypothetical protein
MDPTFFRLIHICGILMIFSGLVGLTALFVNGGPVRHSSRITFAIVHGFGMLLVLISGFGLAGRLGYMNEIPMWMYFKMAIWLVLGGSMVLAKRQAKMMGVLMPLWILLGTVAGYLALYKPV